MRFPKRPRKAPRCYPHIWVKTGFRVASKKRGKDGYRENLRCSKCTKKDLGRWVDIAMPITEGLVVGATR